MKDLLKQQGLDAALEELPTTTIVAYDNVIQKNAYNTLILCLGDRVLREGSGSVRSKSRGRGSKLRCYICNYEEHLKRDCPRRFYREDAVRREQGYKGFAGGTIRKKKANCVYTLDGQAMTRKTLKGRKQLGEYQTGCKIKTVACEVISKWNARLKEDMDARSHVYVLSNGCKESSDDINDYY
ncbi:zinc finger, CCHC-type containing protein [Tanacetum coccineum]